VSFVSAANPNLADFQTSRAFLEALRRRSVPTPATRRPTSSAGQDGSSSGTSRRPHRGILVTTNQSSALSRRSLSGDVVPTVSRKPTPAWRQSWRSESPCPCLARSLDRLTRGFIRSIDHQAVLGRSRLDVSIRRFLDADLRGSPSRRAESPPPPPPPPPPPSPPPPPTHHTPPPASGILFFERLGRSDGDRVSGLVDAHRSKFRSNRRIRRCGTSRITSISYSFRRSRSSSTRSDFARRESIPKRTIRSEFVPCCRDPASRAAHRELGRPEDAMPGRLITDGCGPLRPNELGSSGRFQADLLHRGLIRARSSSHPVALPMPPIN